MALQIIAAANGLERIFLIGGFATSLGSVYARILDMYFARFGA